MIKHTLADYLGAARVLVKTNPYCRGMDPEHFAQWAKEHTERTMQSPGYWDCRGIVVTVYMPEDADHMAVKVSLSTYTIETYLESTL